MCLGAFVDTGLDIRLIAEELKKLPIDNYELTAKKTNRCGIACTKVDVLIHETEGQQNKRARIWADIAEMINSSNLSQSIKEKGLLLFKKLFEAEGRIHGEPYDKVHLHELGAVDCLVDIFGALIAIELLEVKRIYVSEINLGSGSINTSHGVLPIPAPATIELLKGYPVYSYGIPFELTTPTGALIISGLEAIYSPLPSMIVENVGYGAGHKDINNMPNLLRIYIGNETSNPLHDEEDIVTIIETNIDDMNPQFYEDVMEKLFIAGALDVTFENIIMKKSRPAVKLSIISKEKDFSSLADILFKNTTTLGLRYYNAKRKTLKREIKTIKTGFGDVRIKISKMGENIVNISPEYDDIKALSKKTDLPIKRLTEIVLAEIPQKLIKT